ncbi:MAG: isocitrate lyase/phosphoenolpyruvate mutase family protein [Betaproteobacteria bacterium]
MSTQLERAETFKRLHINGDPITLFNVWDAGTARVVADAGAKALATGSWSVAAAHGCSDGQALSLPLAIENLARIVANVSLPVTIDLEAGYGDAPEIVAATVALALAAGAIGFNLEDQIIGGEGLYSLGEQSLRIAAAREAADRVGIPAFINARTDIFLQAGAEQHDDRLGNAALHRALAYAEAGASGFFVPGLTDERLIGALCKACPLPVNIMVMSTTPPAKRMAELGVARISHGPGPYRQMMQALADAARLVYAN